MISLFFASASISSFYSFSGPARLSGFIASMCWTPPGDETILEETPFWIFLCGITQSEHVLTPKWSGDDLGQQNGRNGGVEGRLLVPFQLHMESACSDSPAWVSFFFFFPPVSIRLKGWTLCGWETPNGPRWVRPVSGRGASPPPLPAGKAAPPSHPNLRHQITISN